MDPRLVFGRQVYDYYVGRGLPPHQAAAMAGNWAWESGGRPDLVNPNDNRRMVAAPHSAMSAQWNGQRLVNLVDFARRQGVEIPEGRLNDVNYVRGLAQRIPLQTQLDFAWSELQGPERGAFDRVSRAGNLSDALAGAVGYHRPAGFTTGRPELSHGYDGRRALAERILRGVDAGPAPTAVAAAAPPPPVRDETRPVLASHTPNTASSTPPAPPVASDKGGAGGSSSFMGGLGRMALGLNQSAQAQDGAAQQAAAQQQASLSRTLDDMQRRTASYDQSRPPIWPGLIPGFARGGAVAQAIKRAASQTDTNPTDAQKSAGNYAKGKVRLHGLEIAIENPKGSTRSGKDKDGTPWRCVLPAHYGDIKRTVGSDSDAVDCYIGDTPESNQVWVVDQVDAKSGRFDEHKCLLCFPSRTSALACYEKAFSDGRGKDRIGSVTQFSVADFKDWLRQGDTTKPAAVAARSGTMSRAGQSAERLARYRGGRVGYADGGSPDSLGLVPPLPGVVIEPSTLTGRENARPERLEGPGLRPFETALSLFDPVGFMPSAPRITVQQPVETLTGRETGLRVPVSDQLPRPTEAESLVGGLLGGAPAWRAAADVVGPAVGTALAAVPRPAAIGASGAGALTLASGDAEPRTETDPRVTRIQTLEKEIRDRERILEGFATRNFQSTTARLQASEPHQKAIDQRRTEITRLTNEMDAEAAARRRTQEMSNATIGELIPGFGLASGVAGILLGGKLAHGIASRGVRRHNDALDDATSRWAGAVQRADVQPPSSLARSRALTEAEEHARQFDTLTAAGPKWTGWAPVIAGGAGAELGFNLPTVIDRLRSEPDSPLRARVNETFTSIPEMGGRIIGAGLVGGGVGKMIGLREASRANAPLGYHAETRALRSEAPIVEPPTALRAVEPPPSTRALPPPSPGSQAEVGGPPPLPPGPPRASDIVSGTSPAAGTRLAPEAAPSLPAASEPTIIVRGTDARGRVYHHHPGGATDTDGNRVGGRRTSGPKKPPKRGRRTKGPEDDASGERDGGAVTRRDGGMVAKAFGALRRYMGGRAEYADGGPVVSGPIVGPTGGREDAKPVAVRSGCYVLPADVVSALGEGNTLKGNELLDMKYGNMRGTGGEMVDILISDGEYVIEPEGVMHDGRGNLQDGHRALDAFVKRVRADNIKMLKGLPGPAKD